MSCILHTVVLCWQAFNFGFPIPMSLFALQISCLSSNMWRFWITSLRNILTSSYFILLLYLFIGVWGKLRQYLPVFAPNPSQCYLWRSMVLCQIISGINHAFGLFCNPPFSLLAIRSKIQFLDMLHVFHKFLPSLSFCIQCLVLFVHHQPKMAVVWPIVRLPMVTVFCSTLPEDGSPRTNLVDIAGLLGSMARDLSQKPESLWCCEACSCWWNSKMRSPDIKEFVNHFQWRFTMVYS